MPDVIPWGEPGVNLGNKLAAVKVQVRSRGCLSSLFSPNEREPGEESDTWGKL